MMIIIIRNNNMNHRNINNNNNNNINNNNNKHIFNTIYNNFNIKINIMIIQSISVLGTQPKSGAGRGLVPPI